MAICASSISALREKRAAFENLDDTEMAELRALLGRFTLDNGMQPFGATDLRDILLEIEAISCNLGSAFMPDTTGDTPLDQRNPALIARSFNALSRLAALALIYAEPL